MVRFRRRIFALPLRPLSPSLRFGFGVIMVSENIFPSQKRRSFSSLGRSFVRKKGGWGERASEPVVISFTSSQCQIGNTLTKREPPPLPFLLSGVLADRVRQGDPFSFTPSSEEGFKSEGIYVPFQEHYISRARMPAKREEKSPLHLGLEGHPPAARNPRTFVCFARVAIAPVFFCPQDKLPVFVQKKCRLGF